MSALLALALALADPDRAALAEIAIEGPVESVAVDLGRFGSTRIEGPWLAGESTTLRVPLPASGELGLEPVVRVEPHARGSARFAGWVADAGLPADLPRALLARTLPPLAPRETRARAAELWMLAGAFLLGAALRRRTWAVVLVGGVACAVFAYAGSRAAASGGRPREVVRVLEGDAAAGGRWLQVDAGLDALLVSPAAGFELACVPEGRALSWTVLADAGSPWRVSVDPPHPGTRLIARRALAHDLPTRAENRFGPLREVFFRDPGGEWCWREEWPAGAPLGPGVPPPRAPPGWLASGLPQGVSVLLASLPGTGFSGRDPPGARAPERVYLRLTGVE